MLKVRNGQRGHVIQIVYFGRRATLIGR